MKNVAAGASSFFNAVPKCSNRAPIDTVNIPPTIAAAACSCVSSDENSLLLIMPSILAGITLVKLQVLQQQAGIFPNGSGLFPYPNSSDPQRQQVYALLGILCIRPSDYLMTLLHPKTGCP